MISSEDDDVDAEDTSLSPDPGSVSMNSAHSVDTGSANSTNSHRAAIPDFPKPWGKEFILRATVARPAPWSRLSPQRMYCILVKNEFRLLGAFSSDTTFQWFLLWNPGAVFTKGNSDGWAKNQLKFNIMLYICADFWADLLLIPFVNASQCFIWGLFLASWKQDKTEKKKNCLSILRWRTDINLPISRQPISQNNELSLDKLKERQLLLFG